MDSHIFLKIKTKWEISKKNLLAFSKYSNFMILTVIKCHTLFYKFKLCNEFSPVFLCLLWFGFSHYILHRNTLFYGLSLMLLLQKTYRAKANIKSSDFRSANHRYLSSPVLCLWWKEAFTKHIRRFFLIYFHKININIYL